MNGWKMVNVAKLIRAEAQGHGVNDAVDVTRRVFDQIPEDEYGPVLLKILRSQVTMELGRHRSESIAAVKDAPDSVMAGVRLPEPSVEIDLDATPVLPLRDPRAQEVYDRFWSSMVTVEDGSLRRMRDLSVEDVDFLAAKSFEMARANERRGYAYSRVAEAMRVRHLGRMGDLSDREVRNLFREELTSAA